MMPLLHFAAVLSSVRLQLRFSALYFRLRSKGRFSLGSLLGDLKYVQHERGLVREAINGNLYHTCAWSAL